MSVFISYSRKDNELARRVASILDSTNTPYFLDQKDVRWGDDINAAITGGIHQATHLIAIISSNSCQSQWVHHEISVAMTRRIPILPLRAERTVETPEYIGNLCFLDDVEDIRSYFADKPRNPSAPSDAASIRIAVVPRGESAFFSACVEEGTIVAKQELGVTADWIVDYGESAINSQKNVVAECITQGYHGICLAAAHERETRKSIERAVSAGIPVLIFDSGIDRPENTIVSYVGTNNFAAGQHAALKMAELTQGRDATVAVIQYKPGSQSTSDRVRGFVDAIVRIPNVSINPEEYEIDDTADDVARVVRRLSAQFPHTINAVFSPTEFGTAGMLRDLPMRSAGTPLTFVGFDTSPEIAELFTKWDNGVAALVLQNAFNIGFKAVSVMADRLQGNVVPPYHFVPHIIATEQNRSVSAVESLLRPKLKFAKYPRASQSTEVPKSGRRRHF